MSNEVESTAKNEAKSTGRVEISPNGDFRFSLANSFEVFQDCHASTAHFYNPLLNELIQPSVNEHIDKNHCT